MRVQHAAQVRATRRPPVTTARVGLIGSALPRIEDAVRIGETVRAAAIRIADATSGAQPIPSEISGHGFSAEANHAHAFYLPEDADGDGLIDHVLIHAPGGLSPRALRALQGVRRLWLDYRHEWWTHYLGHWSSPPRSESPYARASHMWLSVTPHLHPWYVKKNFGRADQIARECRQRGFPVPADVLVLPSIRIGGRERRPEDFNLFRSKPGLRQPDRRGAMVRLTFAENVDGPLALGFGCHYGLGMFAPAEAR